MPANTWQPPVTGDQQLDGSFADLSARLAGIDSVLATVAVPNVTVTTRSINLVDQTYVEVRGGGGIVVTLPDAAIRGTGRGSALTVQNFATANISVRAPARNTLNGATDDFTVAPNTVAYFSGNGATRWTGIKPGGGHVIQAAGVDKATEGRLNFLSPFTVTDNPGSGSTDVGITLPAVTQGHVIQEEGSGLTQRTKLNFIGKTVRAYDDSGNSATKVEINGAPDSDFPWLSGTYYPCGHVYADDGGLTFSTATAQDILFAVPRVFNRAGTIDYMAQHFSGQGGTTKAVWHAIYRDNGSGLPGSRVFDHEYQSAAIGNFAGAKLETACNITVSNGELIWFASVQKVNNNPQQLASTRSKVFPLLGTNFDGTGGTNPLRAYVIGYAPAFSYAQPPSTWSGTTRLLAGATDVPMPLIKFTPA